VIIVAAAKIQSESHLLAQSSHGVRKQSKGWLGAASCTSDCKVEVVGSSPIKGPCCCLEQETLPLLL